MPPVTGDPQLGGEETGDVANHEKGRPPDDIYEDDRMDTSSRPLPSASMSEPTKIYDKDSEQLGPFASRKGKIKLDSEEPYPHFPDGFQSEDKETAKSERTLRLHRAWVVHSAWASIENVRKISSSVLVNKLQCKHIANHFQVTAHVLEKLGLGKDFVSGQALEGGTGIQVNLTFDETRFRHIAETFEKHFSHMKKSDRWVDFLLGPCPFRTHIQNVSSMFEDYVRELDALDGSSEESLSKQSKSNEDSSLRGMSMKENVEARSCDRVQHPLDEFLCSLLGVLKQGEDLVLFHSGLEGVNNGVVERTGLYGEKFVEIHKLLYSLLDFYASLHHCEGTEFASGYLSRRDSCGAQSLHYYLNSNCLEVNTNLHIVVDSLTIELATTISQLLERSNCVLKTLCIELSNDEKELRKCGLMVIAALSKCTSLTSLTVHNSNGEEVHELCKSLSVNKDLKYLVISTRGPLADNMAMDLSSMLKENYSLDSLKLGFNCISRKGAAYLGGMLASNSHLVELNLEFRGLNEMDLKHFLWPLMTSNDGEHQVNLSLKRLNLNRCFLGAVGIIAQLLCTNRTLTHFSINMDLDLDSASAIRDSLKENKTLQVLDLLGSPNFSKDSELAATCLEAMVVENSTLE